MILEKILKFIQLLIIFFIGIVFIFFENNFFGLLTRYELIGIVIASIPVAILYFDKKLSLIADKNKNIVDSFIGISFMDAFSIVKSKKKRYKKMRIFAHSSTKIYHFFASSNISIDECVLLVRDYTEEELKEECYRLDKEHTENTILQWKEYGNRQDSCIKKVSVYRYYFTATECQVIFDNDILIQGMYSSDITKQSYYIKAIEPILMENKTPQSGKYIRKCQQRFDEMVAILENGGDKYFRNKVKSNHHS